MKKFIQFIITIIIVLHFLVRGKNYEYEARDFANLISDINNEHYKSTTVILLHCSRSDNILEMDFMFHLTRILLSQKILIITEDIHSINRLEAYYINAINRPFIIVFLTSEESIHGFGKLCEDIDLVNPFWLIIFWEIHEKLSYDCKNPVGNPFHFRFNTELFMKCFEDENIYDWYYVDENETSVQKFATWNPENRLHSITSQELYERRNQISKGGLKFAAIRDHTKHRGISKLMKALVAEFPEYLNLNLENVTQTEIAIGSWDKHQAEWSGIMGQLYRGEVDVSITPVTMTSKRLADFDFSQPIILSRIHLYIKAPGTITLQWLGHFQTFNHKVWFSIIVFLLITPVFVSFIKSRINESCASYEQILSDSYFDVWRIYCQQGVTENAVSTSLKLAYLTIFMSSWIIISIYSGYLISHLTLPAPSLPFDDIEGFLADGTYKLIVVKNSEERDLFQSTSNNILKEMRSLMKNEDQLPIDLEGGFEQVCKERVALYISEAKRQSLGSVPCSLINIKTRRIDSIALAVTKHNQYLGVMKSRLQKFFENGMMNKLKGEFLSEIKELPKTEYVEVGFEEVLPIFAIILCGSCLALLTLFFERINFSHTNNTSGPIIPYLD